VWGKGKICLVVNGGDVWRQCAAIHAKELRVRDNVKFVLISTSPFGAKILNYCIEHVAVSFRAFGHQWDATCAHYICYLALRLPGKVCARTVVALLEGLGKNMNTSIDHGGAWAGILVRIIFICWDFTVFPSVGNKQRFEGLFSCLHLF
jgi:hypothetical protein